MNAAAWTCLLLPLASTVLITVGGTRISRRLAGYISTLTTMGAFVAAVIAFAQLLGKSAEHRTGLTTSWTWLSAGRYHFGLTLLTDQLSIVMMLIVAGVGGLIVAYSVGYMNGGDEERNQNRNNRDDDEQFNQRETAPLASGNGVHWNLRKEDRNKR